ncbi:hypothetical protein AVEN_55429-1 [Araneus ventricosus]|uniref:Uncharacterized protein n=1 Tax=Araneus ventricosus TaxID=182803 RepID=A0A4Y2HUQ0_ARAVE|nr:hypothetical protein AVEN_55429-1 [Araneus ventricosus]
MMRTTLELAPSSPNFSTALARGCLTLDRLNVHQASPMVINLTVGDGGPLSPCAPRKTCIPGENPVPSGTEAEILLQRPFQKEIFYEVAKSNKIINILGMQSKRKCGT